MGFKQLIIEPTIFILHRSEGLIALLIWIDDFAIGTSSKKIYTTFIEEYRKEEGMDIKEEGPLTIFAGIQITWGKGFVELCQSNGMNRTWSTAPLPRSEKHAARSASSNVRHIEAYYVFTGLRAEQGRG